MSSGSGRRSRSTEVRYESIASGVDYNLFDFQIFVDGQAVGRTWSSTDRAGSR
jgi:hypothetical protein